MQAPLERLISYFRPPGEVDDDLARQQRMVVLLSLIACVCCFFYGAFYAALGMRIAAAGILLAALALAALLAVFRHSGNIAIASHVLGAAGLVALGLITLGTGWLTSPVLPWFVLVPAVVALSAGRRAAIPWIGAVIAIFGLVYVTDGHPMLPPCEAPAWFNSPLNLLSSGGLFLALLAIAGYYEGARDEAMTWVRDASDAAATERDRARLAHRDARRVLDHVQQGLVVARLDGTLHSERSAAIDAWFGAAEAKTLWDLFAPTAPSFAQWIEMSWSELESEWMPPELALDQLPKELQLEGRYYSFAYALLQDEGEEPTVMVIVTDDTAKVEAMRAEQAQRELLVVFRRALTNARAVVEFVEDARRLIDVVEQGQGSLAEERRAIHTLKGNCATFGLGRLARWLHELEDELEDKNGRCSDEHCAALRTRWNAVEAMLAPVLDRPHQQSIMVERAPYELVLKALESQPRMRHITREVRSWQWRPAQARLERLAEDARLLSQRLGKEGVRFSVETDGMRYPDHEHWTAFWGSLIHVVRNALDHGIEAPDERAAHGKPEEGAVAFRAHAGGRDWVIEVEDDGRGIDWEALKSAAEAKGMAAENLVDALFHDGVSTSSEVTSISGRGVGMAAVRQATERLGGRVEVETAAREGTLFRFSIARDTKADKAA